MPSSMGTAPPERLVPLPRAMNGTRAAWHSRTASIDLVRDSAMTTARGRARNAVRPSDSYAASAPGRVSSRSDGTRRASAGRSSSTS